MELNTTANDLAGGQKQILLFGTPDLCPRCHRSVHPKYLHTALLTERSLCQAVFRCTHQKCQELFLATYTYTRRTSTGYGYELHTVAPYSIQKAVFPETVSSLSPRFIEIFNQSMEAESKQLEQLVGIGLRKSLEFLVKDYAIAEAPESQEEIRKALLGYCISQYMSDPNVKECAKRAAWLGNDETHYTRKWETKDINDLKLLVRLTVNWIDNSLLTKKYISEMNS